MLEKDPNIVSFLSYLPSLTPRQMFDRIGELGYVGQETARKAVCLMAFRHISRIKRLYLEDVPVKDLPPKSNYLLIGPTGCGKTYLVELLFQKILKIPTVIIDITAYSETGYVGQNVHSILTRLINSAGGNRALASVGIVCIDEFDKIASGSNNAVFSGEGTTKDVSGLGVQRELLKMLESTDIDVPMRLSHSSYSERITFNTGNIPFVACGAFSGFKEMVERKHSKKSIGFGTMVDKEASERKIAVSLSEEEVDKVAYFQSYGLMPELIGRFHRIVPFDALSKESLTSILERQILTRYQRELAMHGIGLDVSKDVYDSIVSRAFERETGARGIASVLTQYIEDACFDAYSNTEAEGIQVIRLYLEDGVVKWRIDISE